MLLYNHSILKTAPFVKPQQITLSNSKCARGMCFIMHSCIIIIINYYFFNYNYFSSAWVRFINMSARTRRPLVDDDDDDDDSLFGYVKNNPKRYLLPNAIQFGYHK